MVMGTKPEDMRYEVRTMFAGGEPWLFAIREGGLDPVAPVRELRVAWQQRQRHQRLVEFCGRLLEADATVNAVDAPHGEVRFTGRALGFQRDPSVVVELPDGTKRQWAASLVRVVSPVAVWDDVVPPGGLVCTTCGAPVESEPCPEHGAPVREVPVRRRADAVDPELVADQLLAGERPGGDQGSTEDRPGSQPGEAHLIGPGASVRVNGRIRTVLPGEMAVELQAVGTPQQLVSMLAGLRDQVTRVASGHPPVEVKRW